MNKGSRHNLCGAAVYRKKAMCASSHLMSTQEISKGAKPLLMQNCKHYTITQSDSVMSCEKPLEHLHQSELNHRKHRSKATQKTEAQSWELLKGRMQADPSNNTRAQQNNPSRHD